MEIDFNVFTQKTLIHIVESLKVVRWFGKKSVLETIHKDKKGNQHPYCSYRLNRFNIWYISWPDNLDIEKTPPAIFNPDYDVGIEIDLTSDSYCQGNFRNKIRNLIQSFYLNGCKEPKRNYAKKPLNRQFEKRFFNQPIAYILETVPDYTWTEVYGELEKLLPGRPDGSIDEMKRDPVLRTILHQLVLKENPPIPEM